MMGELHSRGKTIDDIAEVLKRAPIHPRVISAIRAAHALGYNFSDLISFFNNRMFGPPYAHLNFSD